MNTKQGILLVGIAFLIFCAFVGTASAKTWYVDASNVGDPLEDGTIDHPFDLIQEGIDATGNGDIVLLSDGIYTGYGNKNLFWDGNIKHIIVRSENGANNCIIDCGGEGRGFALVDTYQNNLDVINGFTIKNGNPSADGGGIYCQNSAPIISNNIFTGNYGHGGGGAIQIRNYNLDTEVQIVGNLIYNNTVLFDGAAMRLTVCNANVICNTIYGNKVDFRRTGGIEIDNAYNPGKVVRITNSIIWTNDKQQINNQHGVTQLYVTYCDVQGGWAGTGNIDTDPLFVGGDPFNYHLQAGSPCIEAGTNVGAPSTDLAGNPRPIDGDGNGVATVDMGAFEYVPPTPAKPVWVEVDNPAGVGAYICNDSVDFTFGRNLKRGDSGDDVKYLQIVLNANPATQVAVDGPGSPCHETNYFGELTEAAVIKFQALHGLAQSGEVDDETRAELNKLYLPVKHVPNGWVLNVTNTHQNEEIHDGCIWWEVEDVTDGIKGWVAYQRNTNEIKYLQKVDENVGKKKTDKISDINERKSVIVKMVKNRAKHFEGLSDFPAELILAIIAGEMTSDADNEYISFDCGRGISQVTTNSFVGMYSGVKCYCGTHKAYMPYEFIYPFDRSITKNYWKDRSCKTGSYQGETTYRECKCKGDKECQEQEPWYYGGTDTSGRCKYYSSNDCGCRVYTNTVQGIEANIKDGKGALQDFYSDSLKKNENTELNFQFKSPLKNGDRGKEVAYLQYILKSEIDENLPITSYFGSMTEKALKEFQKKIFPDKKPNGEVDEKTKDKLNELLNTKYNNLRKKVEKIKSWVGATWRYNHGYPKGTIKSDKRNYLFGIGSRLENIEDNFPNCKDQLGHDLLDEEDKQLLLTMMKNYIYFEIRSPIELRIYDSQGCVTGLINGEIREEIPNSIYDEESKTVAIFFPLDDYRYEVVGTEEGSYGLEGASIEGGEATTFTATDIPTTSEAIHQYTIDWDALSQDEEGATVQVDSDGDGVFENTFTADNELSHDEFMLQTATTIDFDPDTLNLQSMGKWVTTYIELPEGYDVSAINVNTVMLNDQVQAEMKPSEIGDYDDDGIPDLMVKFDWSAVQEILEVGDEGEIIVTGELTDGTPFEGSDVIRVIDQS